MNDVFEFFATLVGIDTNPTKKWPLSTCVTPDVDCSRQSVGTLYFGDDFQAARQFGRPDVYRRNKPDYCELYYERQGFQIDFANGRLCYVAFIVGDDDFVKVSAPDMTWSTPCVDSMRLTHETTPSQIEAHFGAPTAREDEEDSGATMLFYSRGKLTVEFEIWDGFLTRVNIFPTKENTVVNP